MFIPAANIVSSQVWGRRIDECFYPVMRVGDLEKETDDGPQKPNIGRAKESCFHLMSELSSNKFSKGSDFFHDR